MIAGDFGNWNDDNNGVVKIMMLNNDDELDLYAWTCVRFCPCIISFNCLNSLLS